MFFWFVGESNLYNTSCHACSRTIRGSGEHHPRQLWSEEQHHQRHRRQGPQVSAEHWTETGGQVSASTSICTLLNVANGLYINQLHSPSFQNSINIITD